MTADAFDLADRLQTPVIVMSDLDLGMNDHIPPPSPGTRPGPMTGARSSMPPSSTA
jgi:pyruvate/2-oxoacid:ferredoxin oxidoreductase alpha subunit